MNKKIIYRKEIESYLILLNKRKFKAISSGLFI